MVVFLPFLTPGDARAYHELLRTLRAVVSPGRTLRYEGRETQRTALDGGSIKETNGCSQWFLSLRSVAFDLEKPLLGG